MSLSAAAVAMCIATPAVSWFRLASTLFLLLVLLPKLGF
jgi:hypothetical protein